jgi:DNA-binding YbaB/EbfC family protein
VNIKRMMEQARQMQEEMEKRVAKIEEEGSAGGGAVTVRLSGKREVLSVQLDPEVVDPEDVEMLQDLILAAFQDASRRVEEKLQKEMGGALGGLGLPGM